MSVNGWNLNLSKKYNFKELSNIHEKDISTTNGLKYKKIKHPHFLLMDTPEEAGIDDITENIILLDKALELSKNNPTDNIGSFQFILTTGINRYPEKYEEFVKLRFNKKRNRFILKERQS